MNEEKKLAGSITPQWLEELKTEQVKKLQNRQVIVLEVRRNQEKALEYSL